MRSAIVACLVSWCAFLTACSQPSSSSSTGRDGSHSNSTAREPVDSTLEEYSSSDGRDAIGAEKASDYSLAVFEQRILPIFQSAKPSSCVECHLTGVELRDYIKPSQEETFVSLVKAGLIDTSEPDDSKILEFIARAPAGSSMVNDETRKLEYEAFQQWIHAACKNRDLLTSTTAMPIGPQTPLEVIRHARRDRVLASFMENIWTEIGRCAACHSPDRNQAQVSDFGEQVSWIKLDDPEATLAYMLETDLIDVDRPSDSLLLAKPTLQVEHEGGQKVVVGDRTYKQFRRFIDDYVSVATGEYSTASDLPKQTDELSFVTDIWFKLEQVPEKYDTMLLQVDLYFWEGGNWSDYRVATSDRLVFGDGNLWQHSLSVTAPRGSDRASELNNRSLPSGRYLAKIYIDETGKLETDISVELGDSDLVGEIEFESQWPKGYGRMTIAAFPDR